MKLKVIENLAMKFDTSCNELCVHGKKVKITAIEVERLLGLPSTGGNVEDFMGKYDEARMTYNLDNGKIHVIQLGNHLARIEGGLEFRAKFLLYAMLILIRPITCMYVSPCFTTKKIIASNGNQQWTSNEILEIFNFVTSYLLATQKQRISDGN